MPSTATAGQESHGVPEAGPWDDGQLVELLEERLLEAGFAGTLVQEVLTEVTPILQEAAFTRAADAVRLILLPLRDTKAGVSILHALRLPLGFSSIGEAGARFGASPQAIQQAARRMEPLFTRLPPKRKTAKRSAGTPPDGSRQWLDRGTTASRLSCSLATLSRYQQGGLLQGQKSADGAVFFDACAVESLRALFARDGARHVLAEARRRSRLAS